MPELEVIGDKAFINLVSLKYLQMIENNKLKIIHPNSFSNKESSLQKVS